MVRAYKAALLCDFRVTSATSASVLCFLDLLKAEVNGKQPCRAALSMGQGTSA